MEYRSDGWVLLPPTGISGQIRIRDRLRPLRSVADIVRERRLATPWLAAIDSAGFPACSPVVTERGEFAALQVVRGTSDGAPALWCLGLIFGDDFYVQIEGQALGADSAPVLQRAVTDLLRAYDTGQAPVRRRRFLYDPPAGWHGYPRGLSTDWLAPQYPNQMATISVFPARPLGETLPGALDRVLHEMCWAGYRNEQLDPPRPVASQYNLHGVLWQMVGAYKDGVRLFTDVAVMQDSRFLYVQRLETTPAGLAEHRPTFELLVQSIRPLPHPRPRGEVPVTTVDSQSGYAD
jgi:hypothetical protein